MNGHDVKVYVPESTELNGKATNVALTAISAQE
jgi:hypothetical protein